MFLAIIVGHLILISAQTRTNRGVSLLSSLVFGAFAEIQRGATATVGGATHVWADYFALQDTRRQNEQLKAEVNRLQIALQQETAEASQSRSLQQLLELKRELPLKTIAARVIGGSNLTFKAMTIDKGTSDGLLPDMAVIAWSGVVGRIYQPSARAAKVQLLLDGSAAAGAIVERSRAQGVVMGGKGADKSALSLMYVSGTADLKVGDRVVTSGVDGIFPSSIDGKYPKGFVIGHIESLERRAGQYENVVVRPAVDFGSLETVLVVVNRPAGEAIDAAIGRGKEATAGNEGR